MQRIVLIVGLVAALAAGAPKPPPAVFDGYAFGMTVAQAEAVAPNRKSFECGRLMTSRCIVYERRIGALPARVTVQFSLEETRVDRVEIAPRAADSSCDAVWNGLLGFLAATYGEPKSREGNTMRWRTAGVAATATVLKSEDEPCDIVAALTMAGAADEAN